VNLFFEKPNSSPSTVFLTGVTGFLGGAFLSHLLDTSFEGEAICLVRADGQEAAEDRVLRSVGRFGHERRLPRNIRILPGDLLGNQWHQAPELDRVTHVLHLAASTSFGNSRGIRRTNVDGALSVAAAMRGRPLLQRYIHTGTATICGAFPPSVVREDDYPSESATHLVAYTRSKAEAERLLAERYADLPIVVARPSIVVGDTRFGCKPSGSIFWVLRAIEALRFIAWDPRNRIDVVPVDWAAQALARLLFAPKLKHRRYHISAGKGSSIRWNDLASEYARLYGGPARDRYERGEISQITPERVKNAVGHGHPRHLLHALELYSRFCSLDLVFDNCRLLKEGVPAPPCFTDYMQVCLESSESTIYEQMRIDLEPSLALA
jgi:nucleoside-diphosphate-sugar epimerase